jgi:hypothetical protein
VEKRKHLVSTAFRLTDEELAMLKDIAEWTGMSQVDVVRQAIRREHERLAAKRKK